MAFAVLADAIKVLLAGYSLIKHLHRYSVRVGFPPKILCMANVGRCVDITKRLKPLVCVKKTRKKHIILLYTNQEVMIELIKKITN